MPVPSPEFDVLIAAGDIHDPLSEGIRWLAERADGRQVIYVPGNHEWYAHRLSFTVSDESKRGQDLADALGIQLLQDREVEIEGVRFLGSTLWTDYALYGDATRAMRIAQAGLNDHRFIYPTNAGLPLSPRDALEWHQRSLRWLNASLSVPFAGPSVVVTHHLPHPRSIHQRFSSDPLTPAFL